MRQLFRDLWSNEDGQRLRTGLDLLAGHHAWLERGILGLEAARAPSGDPAAAGANAAQGPVEAEATVGSA